MGEVVQRRDDVPAVHLPLVDLLGAVVKAGRIAQADRVGGREQAKIRMRLQHLVLIEKRELAFNLEHALDDEHHVRPAGVVLVKDECGRPL